MTYYFYQLWHAMLNICDDYGYKHNILFNSKKYVCFKIDSKWSSATDYMRLNNEDIKGLKL